MNGCNSGWRSSIPHLTSTALVVSTGRCSNYMYILYSIVHHERKRIININDLCSHCRTHITHHFERTPQAGHIYFSKRELGASAQTLWQHHSTREGAEAERRRTVSASASPAAVKGRCPVLVPQHHRQRYITQKAKQAMHPSNSGDDDKDANTTSAAADVSAATVSYRDCCHLYHRLNIWPLQDVKLPSTQVDGVFYRLQG